MLSKYLYLINIVFQCLIQYISFEIMAGAYEISCPDPACEKDGVFQCTAKGPKSTQKYV